MRGFQYSQRCNSTNDVGAGLRAEMQIILEIEPSALSYPNVALSEILASKLRRHFLFYFNVKSIAQTLKSI